MYADDHQLYTTGKDTKRLKEDLNVDIEKVIKWYENHALMGNKDKFKIMTLPGRIEEIQTNIDGKDILPSDQLKLLGLEIDHELNFTSHTQSICKKATCGSKIAVLSRLKNMISINAKLHILCKATILPSLTYYLTIWHFGGKSDEGKLEKLQERALRIMFNNNSFTYDELLRRFNLSTHYNRRLRDILITMFKYHMGLHI